MAYLTRQDLETHIYPEIIKRIIRDYSSSYANLAAFPVTGVAGKKYIAVDTSKTYIWSVDAYEEVTAFDLVAESINAAISEAKGYLRKYDLLKLFGTDATAATVSDVNLKMKVKDLACWHLIKLSNANVNVAMFRTAYEDARDDFFKEIQQGNIDPEGWDYLTDDEDTGRTEGSGFFSASNEKRTNDW
jgi:hypothetical protein